MERSYDVRNGREMAAKMTRKWQVYDRWQYDSCFHQLPPRVCEFYILNCHLSYCHCLALILRLAFYAGLAGDGKPMTPLVRTHTPPPLIGGVCSTNGLWYPRHKVAADGVTYTLYGYWWVWFEAVPLQRKLCDEIFATTKTLKTNWALIVPFEVLFWIWQRKNWSINSMTEVTKCTNNSLAYG